MIAVSVNEKLKDGLHDQLFEAVLQLKSLEECYEFFEDICTVQEMKAISARLEVARMLRAGDIYEDIVKKTGASTATISRIKRCLNYGTGGYDKIIPHHLLAAGQPLKRDGAAGKGDARISLDVFRKGLLPEHMRGGGDVEAGHLVFSRLFQLHTRQVQLIEHALYMVIKLLSILVELNVPAHTVKEPHPQIRLQTADGRTERGGRYVQLICGTKQMFIFRQSFEILKMQHFHKDT